MILFDHVTSDYSFDVKSATLDRDSHYVIDQTPYLTFNHNEINQESFFKDITDTRTTSEDQIQVLRDQKVSNTNTATQHRHDTDTTICIPT